MRNAAPVPNVDAGAFFCPGYFCVVMQDRYGRKQRVHDKQFVRVVIVSHCCCYKKNLLCYLFYDTY
jgi:hypothetical protein